MGLLAFLRRIVGRRDDASPSEAELERVRAVLRGIRSEQGLDLLERMEKAKKKAKGLLGDEDAEG